MITECIEGEWEQEAKIKKSKLSGSCSCVLSMWLFLGSLSYTRAPPCPPHDVSKLVGPILLLNMHESGPMISLPERSFSRNKRKFFPQRHGACSTRNGIHLSSNTGMTPGISSSWGTLISFSCPHHLCL